MTKNSEKPIVKTNLPDGYMNVLESIVDKIKAAQTRAMAAVNRELIEVYKGYRKGDI